MARGNPGQPDAVATNRALTLALMEAGRQHRLRSVQEFPIPGGRLDVVWLWDPPAGLPGWSGPLPVVGFEVESSWRTRKHVKGDVLNLVDAAVALGVIVLVGTTQKDESLREFARAFVQRPGCPILVWTADDVQALAGLPRDGVVDRPPTVRTPLGGGLATEHQGKYRNLWAWLMRVPPEVTTLSFVQVETILQLPLPSSCRAHTGHWTSYRGSAVARAITDAGWRAVHVDLPAEEVTLAPRGGSQPQLPSGLWTRGTPERPSQGFERDADP